MSSSSRSIAAARQKRAGEQSQPMNTSRPVTSISSQGAFAQQQYQQQMMSQSIPVGSKNVRAAQNKGMPINQGAKSSTNIQQEQSTKISVSNAIGLITLRLGKLENYVSEAIEDGKFNENNDNNVINNNSIPSNMKIVSDEVFENILNRLNLLESKMINYTNQTDNFANEMSDVKTSINNLNNTLTMFINETTNKFIDYEYALTEIENNLELDANAKVDEETDITFVNDNNDESNNENVVISEHLENEEQSNIHENNE
jgi:hypothetical protein